MKKRWRRLGSTKSRTPFEQAGNAAAGWCEQEYGGPNYTATEEACKQGVNRLIRFVRRIKR